MKAASLRDHSVCSVPCRSKQFHRNHAKYVLLHQKSRKQDGIERTPSIASAGTSGEIPEVVLSHGITSTSTDDSDRVSIALFQLAQGPERMTL